LGLRFGLGLGLGFGFDPEARLNALGEITGDKGRYGEIWGDMGRYGEIWGDMTRRTSTRLPSSVSSVTEPVILVRVRVRVRD